MALHYDDSVYPSRDHAGILSTGPGILSTGRAGPGPRNNLQNVVLNTAAKEKDTGVTIEAGLKVSEQCGIAARKRN